jgi:hypothetical protein
MRLALPVPPAVHVFAACGDRQPPQGPCSCCGQPLGADPVELRAGDVKAWRCRGCFASLEAEWEEQRRARVSDFMADRTAALGALAAAAPRWRVVGAVMPAACGELALAGTYGESSN